MRLIFEVVVNGEVAYSMAYPAEGVHQIAEFTKIAINDFRSQQPGISLFAPDVSFRWRGE